VSEAQRTDLDRIKQNARHLNALITKVITFVRTEGGHLAYQFGAVPIQSLLKGVVDMMGAVATERGFALDLRPGDPDAAAWADEDGVRQVVLNLVSNAVEHGTPGSGDVSLGFAASPDAVMIYVADAGPGISADRLKAIFDPFSLLPDGQTDRRNGVGLGLAISRDLARAMRGDVAVESTVGTGSRFTLTLPRARSQPAP
jgi:signal transduction histidine kinase